MPSAAPSVAIFTMTKAKEAPRSSKTMLTVVDVGMPKVLNTSRRTMSVAMTARKMSITSRKVKYCGEKMPCRAMSIIPLLRAQPAKTPMPAMKRSVLNFAAREPIAELRKFTASLLTPTQRSKAASKNKKTTIEG